MLVISLRLKSLKKELKKEHLIYRSAGIDATAVPNNSSVSAHASNKVGAGQDGRLTSVKSNVPSSHSIIAKAAEKGNTNNSLRNHLSEEGKQVYDYAVQQFSQGNDQIVKAAKESAFLYARMAERWTEIMHEYGDTTYTLKKYMAQHPIVVGNKKAGTYGQPITNMDIQLDKPAPVITIQEKYAGMDWKDLRKKLPGTIENDIVSKKNEKGEYISYVNEATGKKLLLPMVQ